MGHAPLGAWHARDKYSGRYLQLVGPDALRRCLALRPPRFPRFAGVSSHRLAQRACGRLGAADGVPQPAPYQREVHDGNRRPAPGRIRPIRATPAWPSLSEPAPAWCSNSRQTRRAAARSVTLSTLGPDRSAGMVPSPPDRLTLGLRQKSHATRQRSA